MRQTTFKSAVYPTFAEVFVPVVALSKALNLIG